MEMSRSELYQCLAEALSEPPDWLALAGRDWPLFEAALELSRRSPAVREAAQAMLGVTAEPLAERKARYTRTLAQAGRHGMEWYESGALNGKLLSETTFAVERCYQKAGVEVRGAEMPDHAALELAFLAFLASCEDPDSTQAEVEFLQTHAGLWLPALGRSITASGDSVYSLIGRLLAQWLEETCRELGVPGFEAPKTAVSQPGTKRWPVLAQMDACTLCSFCVQACPTCALAIHENIHTTSLFLNGDDCIGCGKCVRTCPEHALLMQEPQPALVSGRHLLRQSQRMTCKACSTPLISQAELAYVAARLGNPSWLDYCPDCRARSRR